MQIDNWTSHHKPTVSILYINWFVVRQVSDISTLNIACFVVCSLSGGVSCPVASFLLAFLSFRKEKISLEKNVAQIHKGWLAGLAGQ